MRDDDEQQLKIELLSQWKLEAESCNITVLSPLSEIDSVTHASVGFRHWSHRDIWIQIGRDLPILRQDIMIMIQGEDFHHDIRGQHRERHP